MINIIVQYVQNNHNVTELCQASITDPKLFCYLPIPSKHSREQQEHRQNSETYQVTSLYLKVTAVSCLSLEQIPCQCVCSRENDQVFLVRAAMRSELGGFKTRPRGWKDVDFRLYDKGCDDATCGSRFTIRFYTLI